MSAKNYACTEKNCTKCGQLKALEDFGINAKALDGKKSQCKGCAIVAQKMYVATNLDSVRAKEKAFREANKARLNERDRIYYAANREARIAYQKNYASENTEKIAVKTAIYRAANKKEIKTWKAQHYAANKAAILASQKVYYEANKEEILERQKLYQPTEEQRKRHTATTSAWRRQHPQIQRAQDMARRYIVMSMPCFVCTKLKTHRHHDDYMKPLTVTFFCMACHIGRHDELRASGLDPVDALFSGMDSKEDLTIRINGTEVEAV